MARKVSWTGCGAVAPGVGGGGVRFGFRRAEWGKNGSRPVLGSSMKTDLASCGPFEAAPASALQPAAAAQAAKAPDTSRRRVAPRTPGHIKKLYFSFMFEQQTSLL